MRDDQSRLLETAGGVVLSWSAMHLLAEHGYRWRPAAGGPPESGPVGDLLHVDLTIEHPASPRLVLGATPARLLAALGCTATFAMSEGAAPMSPIVLTAGAERRSPEPSTFVVGEPDGRAGGLLVVERGPRSVFETLRVVTVIDQPRSLRDGLEAGLQSVSQGRHPQSGLFSTSRGRTDGVTSRPSAAR